MRMRHGAWWTLILTISLPVLAGPGDTGRHQGGPKMPAPRHGGGAGFMPAPVLHLDRLPAGVETVLLAGFTDYVLGDIFYQQQESHYVVVTPPTRVLAATPDAGLIPLSLEGRRYYLREGHDYRRELDGS